MTDIRQVDQDTVDIEERYSQVNMQKQDSIEESGNRNGAVSAHPADDEETQEPLILDSLPEESSGTLIVATDIDSVAQVPPILNNAIEDHSELDELVITTKSEAPQFISLDKSLLTIGRERTNDIPLVGTAVSRHHARLEKRLGIWYVTDLGSTNGSFLAKERLTKNVEYVWRSGHPLQIGVFTLQWQSPRDLTSGQTLVLMPDQVNAMKAELAADGVAFPCQEEQEGLLNVMMDKSELEIGLGDSAEIKLNILSQGNLDKHIEIAVLGIPEHWVNMTQHSFKIAPKKHRSIPIKIEMPESTLVSADDYDFTVVLRDVYTKKTYERFNGTIHVPAVHNFSLRMIKAEGQNAASVKLGLKNLGNTIGSYTLKTEVPPQLHVRGSQWNVTLPAGQSTDVEFRLTAEKRPLVGKNVSYPFKFAVENEENLHKEAEGKIDVTSRIPTIAFVLIVLASVLLIAALFAFLS